MKKIVLASLLVSGFAVADDRAALITYGSEQAYVQKCMSCHGENGMSGSSQYPNIKGQKEAYIVSSLKAYRSGERLNTLMQSQAVGLDDRTIEALAAYYSTR